MPSSPKIPNIRIRFHRSIHDALYAKPLHIDQVIDFDETSEYLTLHLPGCSEEIVLPWVLSQMGKTEILELEFLREKVCQAAEIVTAAHCQSKTNTFNGNELK